MENKPKNLHKWFGLYEKVSKNGATYYTGQSGSLRIKVFRNNNRRDDKDPDLIVYLDTEQREHQNKGFVPKHPQGQEFVQQEYYPGGQSQRGRSQTMGAGPQHPQGSMPEVRSSSKFEQFQNKRQQTQTAPPPDQAAYFESDPGPEEDVPF